MKLDPVQQIVAIVETIAPLGPVRQQVAAAIRRELGGTEVRIPLREPVTLEQINAGLFARVPVRQIASELGVSRATIYRRLSSRKSHAAKG